MLKQITMAILAASVSVAAIAAGPEGEIAKSFELKDGTKLTVFNDGKMSMLDKFGKAASMKPGHVMETKDGQRIIMVGNEIARIETVLLVRKGQ